MPDARIEQNREKVSRGIIKWWCVGLGEARSSMSFVSHPRRRNMAATREEQASSGRAAAHNHGTKNGSEKGEHVEHAAQERDQADKAKMIVACIDPAGPDDLNNPAVLHCPIWRKKLQAEFGKYYFLMIVAVLRVRVIAGLCAKKRRCMC